MNAVKVPATEPEGKDCILDECRFFDTETREWGYRVVCFNSDHADRECPDEHEMFRRPRDRA